MISPLSKSMEVILLAVSVFIGCFGIQPLKL
jgi:hypothetical protein